VPNLFHSHIKKKTIVRL